MAPAPGPAFRSYLAHARPHPSLEPDQPAAINSSHRCPPRDRARFGRQCQCGTHASQSHQRSLACSPFGSRSRRPPWQGVQDAAAATRASARSRQPRVARRYRAASGRRGLRAVLSSGRHGPRRGKSAAARTKITPLPLPQRPKPAPPQARSPAKPPRADAQPRYMPPLTLRVCPVM
jgi:hypothetical protein